MTAFSRTLQGAQPALAPVAYSDATILYADAAVFYVGKSPGRTTLVVVYGRSGTGVQPSATGTLTRRLVGSCLLTGAQPFPTGGLIRRQHRVLAPFTGAQASGTGTLIARRAIQVKLYGFQPVVLDVAYAEELVLYADYDTTYAAGRSPGHLVYAYHPDFEILLRGLQPPSVGQLVTGPNQYHRVLEGVSRANGILTWIRVWWEYVVPGHDQGQSPDEYVHHQTEMGRRYEHRQTGATKIEHRVR